jgi:signal transduction histidine kinase
MDAETNAKRRVEQVPDLPSLCHAVFEGSPLPIATVAGAKHIVSYVNPAFCRLAGKNEDQLKGHSFAGVAPEDGCLALLDRVYRTGEPQTYTKPEYSEAQRAYWTYAMWPVLSADERPSGVLLLVTEMAHFQQQASAINQQLLLSSVRQHELTEAAERLNAQLQREIAGRERMEQALLNSEKLAVTARLAATLAHEINNPLAAITNLIFLLAPLQTSPEARSYIATLDEQVRGLSRIATQMLKFHRDNNHPAEFKLSAVLLEVLEFYRPQAERQRVAIDRRFETEGTIVGFRGEIVQVVTNLLLNALDATSAGGRIGVHLYPAPPWLCEKHSRCGACLSIADTGGGIDPKHYARIFEPFFTTKVDKGTGLGLWLCRGILNRVGGSMRVWSSRRSGRSGTCFSVFLPAEEGTFTPLRRRFERESGGSLDPN